MSESSGDFDDEVPLGGDPNVWATLSDLQKADACAQLERGYTEAFTQVELVRGTDLLKAKWLKERAEQYARRRAAYSARARGAAR